MSAEGGFNKPYRNVRGTGRTTALLMACLDGREDIVRILIDNGADAAAVDDLKQNGLHKATVYDHPEIFKVETTVESNYYSKHVEKKNMFDFFPDDHGCRCRPLPA